MQVFYAIYVIARICDSTKPVPRFSPSKIKSTVASIGLPLPQLRSGFLLDLFMQHFLNFFPLPQGHGAFLPTFCLFGSITGGFSFGGSGLGESCFSFSRANCIKPTGSSPSSSILRRCSSLSVLWAVLHSSYSGNRSPMMVQVSTRQFLSPRLSRSRVRPRRNCRTSSMPLRLK